MLSLATPQGYRQLSFRSFVQRGCAQYSSQCKVGCESEAEQIGSRSLLHDIGKSQIPVQILNKPAPLANRELSIMRQHPIKGAEVLLDSGGFATAAISTVLNHHENISGTGYPYGKKKDQIHLHAQITSVADVYDALTTTRAYRRALTPKEAILVMTQRFLDVFDPSLLSKFVSLVGHYPVGTVVQLNNGCKATVISNDPDRPSRPAIMEVTTDVNGNPLPQPVVVDFRQQEKIAPKESPDEDDISRIDYPVV